MRSAESRGRAGSAERAWDVEERATRRRGVEEPGRGTESEEGEGEAAAAARETSRVTRNSTRDEAEAGEGRGVKSRMG